MRPATITAGASTSAVSSTAVTDVTVARPAGVKSGDVLVAQITADQRPSMASVPAGWTAMSSPLSIASKARVFVYYHVVGDVAAEPAAYTWTMNAARKWGAGMTAYSGVDLVQPFDTPISTRVDSTFTASSVTVPGRDDRDTRVRC